MPRYPHSKLFKYSYRTIVLSGPHIQVLDTRNGRVLYSTANVTLEDGDTLPSGPVCVAAMSGDGRYLATAGNAKRLEIWDLESLTLLSSRELPKKPTSIAFARNTDILVSDKFGDVFRYTLHSKDMVEERCTSDKFASHENPSDGELILGHASLLTACLLTPDEKFIITADRDEHIRVSWYPEGYIIESYCLGHKKYVSAIHIPVSSPARLISGGGDRELKVWDWMTGRLHQNISVFAAVEPFIKVAAQNRRGRENNEGDDSVGPTGEKIGVTKENQGGTSLELDDYRTQKPDTTAPVFVVRRINSFIRDGETHVVFSAVGATAIFEFILLKTGDQPDIRHHDFGKPVIDFTICDEGLIWVLLDADFEELDTEACPRKLVETIQWSDDQRFVDAGSSTLLDSLNTICSLSATADELKILDLYSDLSSLPKSMEGNDTVPEEPTGESARSTGLTKRALGRLKHKHALNQLHHETADGGDSSRSNAKKMKTESDSEG